VYGRTPQNITVTAGVTRLEPGVTRYKLTQIIVHGDYVWGLHEHDIALLELQIPMPLNANIKPVPLLTAADEPKFFVAHGLFRVLGWGATYYGGGKVRDMRYLDVFYVLRSDCNSANNGGVTENMFCAIGGDGISDHCDGDSGSPITVETTTAPKLAGIVSWDGSERCTEPNKFGVYTRIVKYEPWIVDCTSNSPNCKRK
jgi:secreted trypsin-like serine protease